MQAWPETRDTLLARLRDPADMQAWSEFTRLYEPVIKGFVTGRGLQTADAQDICQHVLWAVARAADDWPGHAEPGRFRKWLATVTRNATLNVLQREMRHRGSGRSSVWDYLNALPAPNADLDRAWEMERLDQIYRAAARVVESRFSPEVWQLFHRTTVGGEATEAVALELGKLPGAAYTARSRVMKALRTVALEMAHKDSIVQAPDAGGPRASQVEETP